MIEFRKMYRRFRQFGGAKLLMEYIRLGLLWPITKGVAICLIKRQSLKRVYSIILLRVEPFLLSKYKIPDTLPTPSNTPLNSILNTPNTSNLTPNISNLTPIWWCWLQGYDNAPPLAKACLESLRQLPNVEIFVVDAKNYTQWCEIDPIVVDKYRRGRIPPATFSDILRLSLLVKHGGVWIDSTVLYMGNETPAKYCPSWQQIVDSDLFVFQYTKPGQKWTGDVSTWFIAAKPGNPLLHTLLDILVSYWYDFDCTIDYYIIHLFFKQISLKFPQTVERMPYGYSNAALQLMRHMADRYTDAEFARVAALSPFQKLSYRISKSPGSRSIYHYITHKNHP